MQDEKIMHYLRRGLEKGFSVEHIKAILVKKGYDPAKVNFSAHVLTTTIRGEELAEKKKEMLNVWVPILFVLSIVVIAGLVFVIIKNPQPSAIDQAAIKEEFDVRIKEIDALGSKIDKKQDTIDTQLDEIAALNATIEEKQELIDKQIEELKKLNIVIKDERTKVRNLLMDLLNSILSRS